MTATKSGERREYKEMWQAYDCFFGLPRGRAMHSSPNRLAVSVTQFGSPKGRHTILDSRFWILDCGLKQHDSHCRKRLRGERGSSSIAFMRGSGRAHPLSGTWETWMAPNVQDCGDAGRIGPPHSQSLAAGKALTENPKSISGIRQDSCAVVLFSQSRAASVPGTGVWVSINCPSGYDSWWNTESGP